MARRNSPGHLVFMEVLTNMEAKIISPSGKYPSGFRKPAVLQCVCGDTLDLTSNTNECDRCQRLYNLSGQQLGPREHWGEETGEHPADCV